MRYYYSECDEIVTTYCDIEYDEKTGEQIRVHCERPSAEGFDEIDALLPQCEIVSYYGFSFEERKNIEDYLLHNCSLIWETARIYLIARKMLQNNIDDSIILDILDINEEELNKQKKYLKMD